MSQLIIRKSDRAIFEKCSAPCRENPPLWLRLQWVKRSLWFGSKLVRDGTTWQTDDESLYEFHDRRAVMAGLKLL